MNIKQFYLFLNHSQNVSRFRHVKLALWKSVHSEKCGNKVQSMFSAIDIMCAHGDYGCLHFLRKRVYTFEPGNDLKVCEVWILKMVDYIIVFCCCGF